MDLNLESGLSGVLMAAPGFISQCISREANIQKGCFTVIRNSLSLPAGSYDMDEAAHETT